MANNLDMNSNLTIRDIMDVTPSQRIAMLIDGDNAQPSPMIVYTRRRI